MAYSFDTLVYFSSLIMFIAAIIGAFVYEYLTPRPLPVVTRESTIAANLSKKGSKYKQNKKQTDDFG